MKIGIAGIGVVGGATLRSFTEHQIDVIAYDKFKDMGSLHDLLTTNIVFLCLPTLYSTDLSEYDKTALHDVCSQLKDNKYEGLVVIKSTVEPTTSQQFADKYGLNIIHNPEFLTARTAYEDFHNQAHIIIGRTNNINDNQINYLSEFYKKYYPSAEITICNSTESESIKIFCNCFYSVKIQFFNELFLLCQKLNIDYSVVNNAMLKNGWINPMHTEVPGTDGKLSYGGMCFPKDTNALLSFMKSKNTPHMVMEATVRERNSMRGSN